MRTTPIVVEQQGEAAFDRFGLGDAAGTAEPRQRGRDLGSQAGHVYLHLFHLSDGILRAPARAVNAHQRRRAYAAPAVSAAAIVQNTGAIPNAAPSAPDTSGMAVWLKLSSVVRSPSASPARPSGAAP